jgi:hypothetical protein
MKNKSIVLSMILFVIILVVLLASASFFSGTLFYPETTKSIDSTPGQNGTFLLNKDQISTKIGLLAGASSTQTKTLTKGQSAAKEALLRKLLNKE